MSAVYLSGPIAGLDYTAARCGWRKEFAEMLEDGIVVLSPMRHEGHLSELQGPITAHVHAQNNHFFSQPKMIVSKDFLDIEMSDIVLVNLLEAKKVSIGTMVEIGYAKKAGKTIITVMQDGNMHSHPFVNEVSDAVVDNLHDAALIVNSLLSTGV